MAKIGRPVKRDLILYFAYCIGLTLIGLLMAIGWRDFFAASRASSGISRICLDCFTK
jgi:cytochrome c biogenesis protein CcdA